MKLAKSILVFEVIVCILVKKEIDLQIKSLKNIIIYDEIALCALNTIKSITCNHNSICFNLENLI